MGLLEGLKLSNVWFTYDGRRWVLRGVEMLLYPGRAVYIVGPNGAGKTTLLRVAGLVSRPVRGRVFIDGVDYWRDENIVLRRKVVYVPSTPLLVRGTLLDNIALGLELRGFRRNEAREVVREWLRKYGLEWLVGVKQGEETSGLAQLVHVLRGIVVGAKYIVLDEPTTYLDSSNKRLLAEILKSLIRDKSSAVIAAGHDVEFASLINAEVQELRDGVLWVRRGASSSSYPQ